MYFILFEINIKTFSVITLIPLQINTKRIIVSEFELPFLEFFLFFVTEYNRYIGELVEATVQI